MKKLFVIGGVAIGLIVLAGCGSQTNPPVSPLPSTQQTLPVKPSNNSSLPNATVPQSTAPATTKDVDNTLDQVNSDLNSIDSAAPNPNDINSADLQK